MAPPTAAQVERAGQLMTATWPVPLLPLARMYTACVVELTASAPGRNGLTGTGIARRALGSDVRRR